MKIVSFCTPSYKKELDLLYLSLKKCDMDKYFIFYEIEENENWHVNVSHKARIIKEALVDENDNILYIDADAYVHQNCYFYFDNLKYSYDFSAHWFQGPSGGYNKNRNDDWFLSGTLWINNNGMGHRLMEKWIDKNNEGIEKGNYQGSGQKNLREIIESNILPLKIHRLPGSYCYVFDKQFAYPKDEPCIIEHLIASRENKDNSRGKINTPRQNRIMELLNE